MPIILCRICWMEEYNGPGKFQCVNMKFGEDNKPTEGGEMWNFYPCKDGIVRGYIMLTAKYKTGEYEGEYTGTININKLNAEIMDTFIENVNVIFFAMSPKDKINYVVGWYDNATVYRTWKQYKTDYSDWEERPYSFEVSEKSAHLIPEKDRNIRIITAQSKEGRERSGSFPGMSNVFFETSNPIYVQQVLQTTQEYFNQVSRINQEYFHSDNLVEDINAINESPGISETTKKALIDARLGQGQFKDDLIALTKGCAVTRLTKKALLIASHIKPWCKATNKERLDKFNGLLLIPNLDHAFDRGYITFNDDGKIMISDQLTKEEKEILNINDGLEIFFYLEEKHQEYLQYHREYVFRNGIHEVIE